jgi:hypothetical protein
MIGDDARWHHGIGSKFAGVTVWLIMAWRERKQAVAN